MRDSPHRFSGNSLPPVPASEPAWGLSIQTGGARFPTEPAPSGQSGRSVRRSNGGTGLLWLAREEACQFLPETEFYGCLRPGWGAAMGRVAPAAITALSRTGTRTAIRALIVMHCIIFLDTWKRPLGAPRVFLFPAKRNGFCTVREAPLACSTTFFRVKAGSYPRKTSPDDSGRFDGSPRVNLGLLSRQ
jgi:hypothetical protein